MNSPMKRTTEKKIEGIERRNRPLLVGDQAAASDDLEVNQLSDNKTKAINNDNSSPRRNHDLLLKSINFENDRILLIVQGPHPMHCHLIMDDQGRALSMRCEISLQREMLETQRTSRRYHSTRSTIRIDRITPISIKTRKETQKKISNIAETVTMTIPSSKTTKTTTIVRPATARRDRRLPGRKRLDLIRKSKRFHQ